ncbi:hypothetical protein Tco_0519732 [Tanacetum coccineum]
MSKLSNEMWDQPESLAQEGTRILVFIIRIRRIGVEMIDIVQGQQCVRKRKVFRIDEFRIHKSEEEQREDEEELDSQCQLHLDGNLQQASTSSTQTDKAPVYDSDGSAEYTEILDPITKPHMIQQNNSNVISVESSMEHNGGIVEQHPTTVEETRAYFESLYNNLVTEVEKVNTVNRKMTETNADLTTKLARYKNQEKCFEINQEKYDTV